MHSLPCIHPHAHADAFTYTLTPTHPTTRTHPHMQSHMHTHLHMHSPPHMHSLPRTCTHTYTCTHTGTCIHTYTRSHAHAFTHIHTCTRTHTCTHPLWYGKKSPSQVPGGGLGQAEQCLGSSSRRPHGPRLARLPRISAAVCAPPARAGPWPAEPGSRCGSWQEPRRLPAGGRCAALRCSCAFPRLPAGGALAKRARHGAGESPPPFACPAR